MKRIPVDPALSVQQIMHLYNVSRAVAYQARNRGYVVGKVGRPTTRTPAGFKLEPADVERVATLSARLVVGRRELNTDPDGYDRYQECVQAARIELWVSGADTLPLAFSAGRRACLRVVRTWNKAHRLNNNFEMFDESKE